MSVLANHVFGRRAFSLYRTYVVSKSGYTKWFIASSFSGLSLYVLFQKPVYNDAIPANNETTLKKQLENVGSSPLVWGSNLNHLIFPERSSSDCIKSPTYAPELFSNPLRDLVFSHTHAACIDASGNVYQWGDGFFGSEHTESKQPRLTLRGNDIVSLAITSTKLFALSSSGRVHVLSSSLARQTAPLRPRSVWNIFGSTVSQPLYTVLDTDVPLGWGEKITSICAGSDHLLALTSSGRTFAHPVTRHANCHGQLGLRKISIQDPADTTKRLPLELTPNMPRDNLLKDNTRTPGIYRSEAEASDPIDDKAVEFCGRFFEVPALRGIDVQLIAAGNHTSYVVTRREGRVLGWGANQFGQLGLGANITLPNVSVPTEIVFNKYAERGSSTRCIGVAAGGDLAFFTVEKAIASKEFNIIDVFACGNGQWGGLGNGSYSNAQGVPVKVKSISGILEYDEKTDSLKALKPHHISVSPGSAATDTGMHPSSSGHVIATLDTIPLSHPGSNSGSAELIDSLGRDVFAWGLNQHYQLGNGKRSSLSTSMPIETADHEGRLTCRVSRETVKDFNGSVVKRKMEVEQKAVAGPSVSVIYWRIV